MSQNGQSNNPIIIIECVDRESWRLAVTIDNMPSLDNAINMLHQVARKLEHQQRMGIEQEEMRKIMQAQADEQLRMSVVGGRKQ